jgi:hypothetical protein
MKNLIINNKKGDDDDNNNSLKSSVKVKVGIAITVAAASALAILTLVYAGGTAQVFAPPPAPCPACATIINGTGEGTITVPEDSELANALPCCPCPECDAEISFEAFEDAKGTGGTITIKYTNEELGVDVLKEATITGGKISEKSFKLEGVIPREECGEDGVVNIILKGNTGEEAIMSLKGEDGIQGKFVGNVVVSIIESDASA